MKLKGRGEGGSTLGWECSCVKVGQVWLILFVHDSFIVDIHNPATRAADPDPHGSALYSEAGSGSALKWKSDPDSHQIQNSGAFETQNGPMEGRGRSGVLEGQ